ncbi:MAG: histidine phosphatase family protein [Gemmatimonadetes bacterium]|nr:histidine phosphatase family protein [Gemmatimonadota bacterium]NNM06485.1 histidine phosphatase family protein [Gemmatimonadota bacterium]
MRFGALTCLAVSFLALPIPTVLEAQDQTVIFLVRHAERADDVTGEAAMAKQPEMAMAPQMMSDDPPLSEAGMERADLLATMLRDGGITHIHSTDYLRTRQTAEPTVEATGVDLSIYDASDLKAFAGELRSAPGTHLVVGHSNTTPGLVEALGGDPGTPIGSLEYDRLYLVIIGETGIRTVLLRFGEPFPGS